MQVLRNGRRALVVALVGLLLITGVGVVTLRGQSDAHVRTEITVADAFAVPRNDPSQIEDPSNQPYPSSDDTITDTDCGPVSSPTASPAPYLPTRLGCAP